MEATSLEIERVNPREEAEICFVGLGTEMELDSIPVDREGVPVIIAHVGKVALSVTMLIIF